MKTRGQSLFLLIAVVIVLLAGLSKKDPPSSKTVLWTVESIADGDTIRVLDDAKNQFKVRLFEIDAPETGQAFGTKSREALGAKLRDKKVRIEWTERDQYDRILGKVYVDDRWINQEMVAEGWAWHYRKFSKSKELADAEAAARGKKLGLWADAHPIPPWQYRWQQREAESGKK